MACPKCSATTDQEPYLHADDGGKTTPALYCGKCTHRYLVSEAIGATPTATVVKGEDLPQQDEAQGSPEGSSPSMFSKYEPTESEMQTDYP